MTEYVTVGVDIGGTTTRVVAFGPDRSVLAERQSATPAGGAAVLDHVCGEFARVTAGLPPARHLGVGVPGRVTADGTVAMALNVGITDPVPLAEQLAARLDVAVVVENDVNAAAVAALAALGGSSLTFVSIGTGFAVGSIVDGNVVRGATGGAGELGHVTIPNEDTPCVCGQRGCIEAIVSGRALADAAAAIGLGPSASVADLWDAAGTGRPDAVALRARAVAALAWTAQVAVLVLDVEHVVFGGGVSELGDRLLAPIRDAVRAREAASPWLASVGPSARLRLAPGDGHLGAIGADLSARRRLAGRG